MAAVVKYPGIAMLLGGVEYIVPPLSLNGNIQYGDQIAAMKDSDNPIGQGKLMLEVIHAALLRNYPEISIDIVGEQVDLGNMQELFEAVMDVSGMKRKSLEAGAAGEVKPRKK